MESNKRITIVMGSLLIGVPLIAFAIEELFGEGAIDLFLFLLVGGGASLAILIFLAAVGRLLWTWKRQDPKLPQMADPRIGDPLGVWFPDGIEETAFVAFELGTEGKVLYLEADTSRLPVGFEIGHGIRYRDPETGGVWTLPTKEGRLDQ